MFLGEYQASFTGKGRIILPRKLRDQLGGLKVILSRGLDQCIWGFDPNDWQKQVASQLDRPLEEAEARDLRRYLFSAAEEVELDGQGRVVIPSKLLEYAGIGDEVVLIGAGDHFEIWQPKHWQRVLKRLEDGRDWNK